jgi:hypothetical protein
MSNLLAALEERFIPEPNSGCWLWIGDAQANGYGRYNGTVAHRVTYELLVGPIPTGLTLDHKCRIRCCVNPAHLEPVTNVENVLRGDSVPAKNRRKTHCEHGHPFDEQNTRWLTQKNGNPGRNCRACAAAFARKYRAMRPKPKRPLKSHCFAGHPFSGDNLYVAPNGKRFCRVCIRIRAGLRADRAERQPKQNVNARKTHCPRGHAYDIGGNGKTRRCRTCERAREERRRLNRIEERARTGADDALGFVERARVAGG